MAQNTRNSDLSQIAVNANNIPDGGCRRRAWFTFLSCAINSLLPPPSCRQCRLRHYRIGLVPWSSLPEICSTAHLHCGAHHLRLPARRLRIILPDLGQAGRLPVWLQPPDCGWVSSSHATRSTYRKNASGCRPQHAETSEWGWGFPDREVYQFCDIVYDSNNVCVCVNLSVCECVCHQIQALAGTSKCVIITIIGRVNRESLKRIRFRLLRNVTVFSCRSHEYILCIIYTICLRTSATISVTLKLRLIRFILFIVEKLYCSALGIDGNYEVDNNLKIESRKT